MANLDSVIRKAEPGRLPPRRKTFGLHVDPDVMAAFKKLLLEKSGSDAHSPVVEAWMKEQIEKASRGH